VATFAPSLARLRNEINQKWPNRDKRTDGWIGDTSHAGTGTPESGGSDHNPNRRGVVDAYDIDVDGISCPAVVAKAIAHPATNYVIWSRKIWSRSQRFAPRTYTGSNPHTDHIHVSILQTVAAETSTKPWGIAAAAVAWPQSLVDTLPQLKSGSAGQPVRKLQAGLNARNARLSTDGQFGPKTLAAVKAFQTSVRLTADGIVGPKTWAALVSALPTLNPGADATAVTLLKCLLMVFGYPASASPTVYDPTTVAQVKALQGHLALTADGIVGPLTWTAVWTR